MENLITFYEEYSDTYGNSHNKRDKVCFPYMSYREINASTSSVQP